MLLRRYHEQPAETDSLLAKDADSPVEEAEPIGTAKGGGKPAGNSSRDEWVEYAVSQGLILDSLEELSRNEIRDLFDN
jgi:hypothetical protein